MRDFRKLAVWEKSHRLTLAVYVATRRFPREELYALTSQLRRSCASVPSNIAEGCGRTGSREFARYLDIASGSASEVEYHLILARDLQYLGDDDYGRLTSAVCEVKQMLTSLVAKVRPDH